MMNNISRGYFNGRADEHLIYKENTYLIVDEKEEPKIKEMIRLFLQEHANKNIEYKVIKKIDKNIYVYEVSE